MVSKQYQSGAVKRKAKKQKIENEESGLQKNLIGKQ